MPKAEIGSSRFTEAAYTRHRKPSTNQQITNRCPPNLTAIAITAKLRPLRSERRYCGAMSVTTNQPRGLNLPSPKLPIVPVTPENVRDWWALFVNRKAYTRQSANTHPDTGRHYHYQAKN